MPTAPPSRSPLAVAAEGSRYLVLILVFYFVATYLVGASARLFFPFALEWIEGSVVDQVARVVEGLPIYVEPSVDYVPGLQTPLYLWISAGFAQVIGVGFAAPRLVSLLATLGCMGALYMFVWRESASRHPALIAAALYAATYQLSGSWFDLARVDSLGLLFILLGALDLRRAVTLRRHLLAGGLLAAAFFTEQTSLVVTAALCVYCVFALRGAQRFALPLATLGLIALGTLLANQVSDGWFEFYVFDAPWQHFRLGVGGVREYAESPAGGFWTDELAATLPLAGVLALGFVAFGVKARPPGDLVFYSCLAAGMLGMSWLQRAGLGSDLDALMPAHALIALYAGLAIHALPVRFGDGPDTRAPAVRGSLVGLVVHALCIMQLVALVYDPGAEMPREVDRQAGERLVDLMAQIDGEIWSPAHGQLPRLAGHAASAHNAAILDVVATGGPVAAALSQQIDDTLAEQRHAVIFAPLIGFENVQRMTYVQTRMGAPKADGILPRGHSSARALDIQLPRHR
jgi:hypothetical protein